MIPHTITTKGKEITFTTDAPEFKRDLTIDSCLDKLKEEFNISNFKINVHTHPGEKKDKDVSFEVENDLDIEKIVEFIEKEFYRG